MTAHKTTIDCRACNPEVIPIDRTTTEHFDGLIVRSPKGIRRIYRPFDIRVKTDRVTVRDLKNNRATIVYEDTGMTAAEVIAKLHECRCGVVKELPLNPSAGDLIQFNETNWNLLTVVNGEILKNTGSGLEAIEHSEALKSKVPFEQSLIAGYLGSKYIFAYDNFNHKTGQSITASTKSDSGDDYLLFNTNSLNVSVNGNLDIAFAANDSMLIVDKLCGYTEAINHTKSHIVYCNLIPITGNAVCVVVYKDSNNYIEIEYDQIRIYVHKIISGVRTTVASQEYNVGTRNRSSLLTTRTYINRQENLGSNLHIIAKEVGSDSTLIVNLSSEFSVFDIYKIGFKKISIGGYLSNYLITGGSLL